MESLYITIEELQEDIHKGGLLISELEEENIKLKNLIQTIHVDLSLRADTNEKGMKDLDISYFILEQMREYTTNK